MGVNPPSLSPALTSSQSMGFPPPLTSRAGRVVEADDSLVKEVAPGLSLRDGMSHGFHYVTTASEEDLKSEGKPVVIFLHGTGFNWSSWLDQMKYFKSQGVDVISFDLPGHNGSQFENVGDYSFSDIARKFHDQILPDIMSRQYLIVAHDLGGGIGHYFTYYYGTNHNPDPDFLGFVSINSPDSRNLLPSIESGELRRYQRSIRLFAAFPRLAGGGFTYSTRKLLDFQKENRSEISRDEMRLLKFPLKKDPKAHYLMYYQNKANSALWGKQNADDQEAFDIINKYGVKIASPVLFIGSTHDGFLKSSVLQSPDPAFFLNAELKTVESGHTPQLEKPDEVNGYLLGFYNKVMNL